MDVGKFQKIEEERTTTSLYLQILRDSCESQIQNITNFENKFLTNIGPCKG